MIEQNTFKELYHSHLIRNISSFHYHYSPNINAKESCYELKRRKLQAVGGSANDKTSCDEVEAQQFSF